MICRRPTGVKQGKMALIGTSFGFLLVAWESYMTPSRTALHFLKAIWIRVKRNLIPENKEGYYFLHARKADLLYN
jgi:hypothetical protein